EGEYDCSFRGTSGNVAYLCTIRGRVIKFFSVISDEEQLRIEQINEMKTSDISLFNNQQPFYLMELGKKWSLHQFNENIKENKGEEFEISEIKHLSKYQRKYHRLIAN
ncbi:hypothetical protein PMAYCL1PPCAC_28406, partial [Pristionchus mayeri]